MVMSTVPKGCQWQAIRPLVSRLTLVLHFPDADDEGYILGLDGLRERCQEYYCQFARKWRAVLRIDSKGLFSALAA